MILLRLRLSLVLAVFILPAAAVEAHHNRTLFAFVHAVEKRNFELIRPLFSDGAWEGKDGGVSVKTLDEWLNRAEKAEFEHARGHEVNPRRLVMGFKLSGPEVPDWVYVLLEPAEERTLLVFDGERFPCKWRVAKLTRDDKEAAKFLEHPLDYLEKGHYPRIPVPGKTAP